MTASQQLIPGIIGFAPATDAIYLREIQDGAANTGPGIVNRIRTLYATLDTDQFFLLDDTGRSPEAAEHILTAARALRAGGADFLVVTSNTGSIILEDADEETLPLLSIFDATLRAASAGSFMKSGLLSTRRTAASHRYHRAAKERGITVLVPPDDAAQQIDLMIDREAIRGIQTAASLRLLQDTVEWFAGEGADSVILGCTDLMLFGPDEIAHDVLPIIDSTQAHARTAARLALSGY